VPLALVPGANVSKNSLDLVSALIYQKKWACCAHLLTTTKMEFNTPIDNSVLTEQTRLTLSAGFFSIWSLFTNPISCLNLVLCFDWSVIRLIEYKRYHFYQVDRILYLTVWTVNDIVHKATYFFLNSFAILLILWVFSFQVFFKQRLRQKQKCKTDRCIT